MNLLTQKINQAFQEGNVLTRLIIINIVVWLAVKIWLLILFLFSFNTEGFLLGSFIQWLAVPANLSVLVFRPWTLITYMFLHEDFFHILFNMLWLYWFGKIFLEYLNGKKLLSTYVLGGISGAFLYILSFNIFPVFSEIQPFSFALGASASVLAIVIAISTYVPNYTIYLMFLGPVKIKYIAIFSVLLDLLSIQSSNPGGHIAHLGGALFGYIYIQRLHKGKDISIGFTQLINSITSYFATSKSKLHVSHSSRKKYKSDAEYNYDKKAQQQQMDKILDKISKSGYESLTKEEKEILFKISNKQ
jgi:membrane associated rhomboid family serine protease